MELTFIFMPSISFPVTQNSCDHDSAAEKPAEAYKNPRGENINYN